MHDSREKEGIEVEKEEPTGKFVCSSSSWDTLLTGWLYQIWLPAHSQQS